MTKAYRVGVISSSDSSGGAARAAIRLGRALQSAGTEVEAFVDLKRTHLPWVLGPDTMLQSVPGMVRRRTERYLKKLQATGDDFDRSLNLLPTRMAGRINHSSCSVANIHSIANGFLSVRDVSRITKPVVWTLHDMWAFCGAEHYASDSTGSRWQAGYSHGNRGRGGSGLDFDALVWTTKRKLWKRRSHIITPSKWLSDCVKASALMYDWPVRVIPNPVDLENFRPMSKAIGRSFFNLPSNAPLVAFGAYSGILDPRKGFDLLLPALARLSQALPLAEAVVFGQGKPEKFLHFPMRTHFPGHLDNDALLAQLYNAVDVMVVPSRIENLPQAATEAQACGCPVVAFAVGGNSDAVSDGNTGFLVEPFNVDGLYSSILKLLTDKKQYGSFAEAARKRSVLLWNEAEIARQYLDVFEQAISLPDI